MIEGQIVLDIGSKMVGNTLEFDCFADWHWAAGLGLLPLLY